MDASAQAPVNVQYLRILANTLRSNQTETGGYRMQLAELEVYNLSAGNTH